MAAKKEYRGFLKTLPYFTPYQPRLSGGDGGRTCESLRTAPLTMRLHFPLSQFESRTNTERSHPTGGRYPITLQYRPTTPLKDSRWKPSNQIAYSNRDTCSGRIRTKMRSISRLLRHSCSRLSCLRQHFALFGRGLRFPCQHGRNFQPSGELWKVRYASPPVGHRGAGGATVRIFRFPSFYFPDQFRSAHPFPPRIAQITASRHFHQHGMLSSGESLDIGNPQPVLSDALFSDGPGRFVSGAQSEHEVWQTVTTPSARYVKNPTGWRNYPHHTEPELDEMLEIRHTRRRSLRMVVDCECPSQTWGYRERNRTNFASGPMERSAGTVKNEKIFDRTTSIRFGEIAKSIYHYLWTDGVLEPVSRIFGIAIVEKIVLHPSCYVLWNLHRPMVTAGDLGLFEFRGHFRRSMEKGAALHKGARNNLEWSSYKRILSCFNRA